MKKQIKYNYCVDENNRLVHISELTKETRHSQTWRCPQCGQILIPNLGEKNRWHFSHKANTACDGETDLHKLAKRRIREKFESSDSFPITFVKDVPCSEHKECPFFYKYCYTKNVAIPHDLIIWEGRILYNDCQEEIQVGEFRPDLLLTNSKKSDREPIFIEINVTHQSEEKKLKSKYRIIETKRINSEDDIEDIINRGFVESIDEGGNCETYNFDKDKLKSPLIKAAGVPIERFVLFKNGAVLTFRASDYIVFCEQLNEKFIPNSAYELNIKKIDIKSQEENIYNKTLDSYELGLIYLTKRKKLQIKNCILCKFSKFKESYGTRICTRYDSLELPYQLSRQTIAKDCPFYNNQDKLSHPLSELEKFVSEVPV